MNSLDITSIYQAADWVAELGYEGLELCFGEHFNPYTITESDIRSLRSFFGSHKVKPVAISTATPCFLSSIPHEPSLISLDKDKRRQRVNLVKAGLKLANKLDIPIVSFQSGYLREEHISNNTDVFSLLVESICSCMQEIGEVTLVIEPEPGMVVEKFEQAKELIEAVGSKQFQLHTDICHAYCTEEDYIQNILNALPYTSYMHLADIKEGYNLGLKVTNDIINFCDNINLAIKSYLIYDYSMDVFLFVDSNRVALFHDNKNKPNQKYIEKVRYKFPPTANNVLCCNLNDVVYSDIPYNIQLENKAFLNSVGGISFEVLEKAKVVLRYLRTYAFSETGTPFITKPVCNTIQGKVHYHEIPGDGEIDFSTLLQGLANSDYEGFITVELYNHAEICGKVAPFVLKYLNHELAENEVNVYELS